MAHRAAAPGELSRRLLMLSPLAAALPLPPAPARAASPAPAPSYAPRSVPARLLPVPDTVSPALRARIAAPYPPGWNTIPGSAAAWKTLAAQSAAEVAPELPDLVKRLGVRVTPGRIAGVGVFFITPNDMPPANRDRLLLHLHGGGYVLFPGEAGAGEGMLMAGYGKFPVVSVDYRMPPDFPFPAALDDAIAVWRALVRQTTRAAWRSSAAPPAAG